MKLKKIMIVFASILILLLQESYANPLGRVIAVAGGQILLEFVGGFANKLGETTAEALIRKYPPPPPKEQKRIYEGQQGGALTYEYVGNRGGVPVYRVISDSFKDEDLELPALNAPSAMDIEFRQSALETEISRLIDYYRLQAKIHCIGDVDQDSCVYLTLEPLGDPNNVRKIMNKIGARPDEYNLVYMLITNQLMRRGF